jgi:hypothetical protein
MHTQRAIVDLLDLEVASLLNSLSSLTRSVPNDLLYRRMSGLTVGENILKSAGVIEQTCGGITTNLWDDPFEWTLPETLSTTERILDYLSEVVTAKNRAFAFLGDDEVLLKYIAAPWSDNCQIIELLLQTLMKAAECRGKALATLEMLFHVDRMPPGK